MTPRMDVHMWETTSEAWKHPGLIPNLQNAHQEPTAAISAGYAATSQQLERHSNQETTCGLSPDQDKGGGASLFCSLSAGGDQDAQLQFWGIITYRLSQWLLLATVTQVTLHDTAVFLFVCLFLWVLISSTSALIFMY